jgi:hypothetical protein
VDSCLRLESASELVDQRPARLDAFGPKRGLEIGDDARAQGGVILGAPDEIVETSASLRELLCGADPGLGRGRQPPQQLGNPDLVVPAHEL